MNKEKFLPAIIAIVMTAALAFGLAVLSIETYELYGYGIFIVTPITCGMISTWIYNRKGKKRIWESLSVSCIAGCLSLMIFFLVGLEGVICLVMAMPVVLPLYIIGGLIGYLISNAIGRHMLSTIVVLILLFSAPFFIGFEAAEEREPIVRKAVTRVEISGSLESVWNEVIQFSKIPDPEEFLFRIGIAYPTDARIEGSGVGAVRYCNFSTGSFVEPITHWEENRKLAFDVVEQPHPMTEVTPYKGLHPPHLDWAIRSLRGQFLLTQGANGVVELEGTTWFHTSMEPEPYWSWIAQQMIHRIHKRVLEHIQFTVEEPDENNR